MTSDQQQNTAAKRKKVIRVAALLLMLVVFPAVSWLYLKGGITWRKEALAELGNFGKVPPFPLIYADGSKIDRIEGCACVIYRFEENPELTPHNQKVMDLGQQLYKQFGEFNPQFRLVMLANAGSSEFRSYKQKLPSIDYATWAWSPVTPTWNELLNGGFNMYCHDRDVSPYPHYFALTDKNGIIKRFYNAESDKEIGRMIEQIAILIPPPPQ
ncbi:MAG: hypothetical protein J0L99_08145 [Chitinophagales bacterium]|nr:hypothetical protein [Chitinophagales bacterium]